MDIKKKKIIKAILAIIFVIIIILFWLIFGEKTFAKHIKTVASDNIEKIAKPVFVVDGSPNIKIDGIHDTLYDFNVKNYDDTQVSQVDLDYYIEIVNDSEADLGFELTKNGQVVELNDNKSNLIELSSLYKQNDNYKLQIKNNNNPNIASDIKGNVQIKVEAVQSK